MSAAEKQRQTINHRGKVRVEQLDMNKIVLPQVSRVTGPPTNRGFASAAASSVSEVGAHNHGYILRTCF